MAMATLDRFRPSVGAFAVGMAQAALDVAVAHAAGRRAFGRPLSEFQAVAHALAEAATRTQAARLLVYEAASRYDADPAAPGVTGAAAMAKLYATETAQAVVDQAVQVLGARALERGHLLEHLYREVRAPRIYEGTSEIQRTIIARELFRAYRGEPGDSEGEEGRPVSPFTGSAGFTQRWEHFGYAEEAGVATVTFDRPERLNALTFEVYADLRDLLAELPSRDGVRVLVLTGRGRGFCSGGDVRDIIGALQAMGPRELLDFTRMTGAVVQGLRELPLPVVAAVNGVAAGAGAVIALAADLRLLARSASLAFLFTRVGLSGADMGCAYLLPRLVGLGRATELLLLGDRVDADQAAALGLANRVVDDDRAAHGDRRAGRAAGRRPGPGLRRHQGAARPRARPAPGRGAGAGGGHPGPAAHLRGPPRVLRRLHPGPLPHLAGPMTRADAPTPHRVVNPEGLAPPVGFAHAVVAAPGRTVYLGGQAAQGPDGAIRGATLAEQFEVAAGNLVAALAAAGGPPEHLVSLHVYTTEVDVYRASLGRAGRRLPPPPGPPLCGHGPVRGRRAVRPGGQGRAGRDRRRPRPGARGAAMSPPHRPGLPRPRPAAVARRSG